MRDELPPIHLLYAFEAAARHGSFKQAAAELHVTASAVSQQVRTLEEHLGLSLFLRQTRAVKLTDDGVAFFRVAQDTLETYHRGAGEFVQDRGRRRVRVSMMPFVAYELAIPKLHHFQSEHPNIDLRIETQLSLANIGAGEADAGIRLGRGPWSGLRAFRLARAEAALVCAPSLLGRGGRLRPASPTSRLLISPSMRARARKEISEAGYGELLPAEDLVFDNIMSLMLAAERGLGVAVGIFPLIAPWIASGRLALAVPERMPMSEGFYFVQRKGEEDRKELAAVKRWMRAEFTALSASCAV